MARKIICDRCGKECTGTHGTLELNRTQSTAQNEPVGYDHFDILDLCDTCTEVARTTFGFKISQQHLKEIEQLAWGDQALVPPGLGGGGSITATPSVTPGGPGEHYTPPHCADCGVDLAEP